MIHMKFCSSSFRAGTQLWGLVPRFQVVLEGNQKRNPPIPRLRVRCCETTPSLLETSGLEPSLEPSGKPLWQKLKNPNSNGNQGVPPTGVSSSGRSKSPSKQKISSGDIPNSMRLSARTTSWNPSWNRKPQGRGPRTPEPWATPKLSTGGKAPGPLNISPAGFSGTVPQSLRSVFCIEGQTAMRLGHVESKKY